MKERLRKLRRTLDITQQEFANKIGIKRNSYANYETGRNIPIDAILVSICREFNVREEWLRTGKGEMFNPDPSDALDALAIEYDLTHRDYVFLEKLLKNKKFLALLEDFCIDTGQSLCSDDVPSTVKAFPCDPASTASPANFEELSDEEKVEKYRQELKREREAREKSGAS